jgi:hypothetical protein
MICRLLFLSFGALAATACHEPASSVPDLAPASCTDTFDPTLCQKTLSWANGPTFTDPRDHHAAVVHTSAAGPSLYVIGGIHGSPLRSVQVAPIETTGALGAYGPGRMLPSIRGGAIALDARNAIVLTGGANGSDSTTDVLTSAVATDGSLGDWTVQSSMTAKHFHHGGATYHGYLYVVGGLARLSPGDPNGTTPTDVVERAKVDDDGTVGTWEALTPLPNGGRSHIAVFVYGDALYVAGGIGPKDDATVGDSILRAPFNADGTLGAWAQAGKLSAARSVMSSAILDDVLYLFGGLDASFVASDAVEYAVFAPDGTLGVFAQGRPLPVARAHVHQAPVFGGRIYSTGGSDGLENYYDDSVIGEFTVGPRTQAVRRPSPIQVPGPRRSFSCHGGLVMAR